MTEQERTAVQMATRLMTPEAIARWWATTALAEGEDSALALALADALAWKHPDPDSMRVQALAKLIRSS